jgi:hypothetical protein
MWFSPGTPASSTTKTGCHDITEILLKVALNTIKSIKIKILLVKDHYHSFFKCEKLMDNGRQVMAKAHIALSTINQQTGKKQVAMKPNFQPFILNQYQK